MTPEEIHSERLACLRSPAYFILTFCQILIVSAGAERGAWVPFTLWPWQIGVVETIHGRRKVVVLKARQLGLSWLALAYALWGMLFCPPYEVLVFSRREKEAVYLVAKRLIRMHAKLPPWLQSTALNEQATSVWELSNGSVARAFATGTGDSYTASLAIIDEADLVADLDDQLASVGPTVEAGGKLLLISRVDKSRTDSPFKRTFRGAQEGRSDYAPIFVPWHARPDRDREWYAGVRAEIMARTGSLDELKEQYPATAEEALEAPTLEKRIPAEWLAVVRQIKTEWETTPDIPGLRIYTQPVPGREYIAGADPAEGVIGGDDSAIVVQDKITGRQVAALNGKLEPIRDFPRTIAATSLLYNRCKVNVERNNHGHAVIGALQAGIKIGVETVFVHVMAFSDSMAGAKDKGDGRPGYPTNVATKAHAWDVTTRDCKDGALAVVDAQTYSQVASIDRRTLKAPGGSAVDDLAISLSLSAVARSVTAWW